jgi:hypothetical protein
MKIKDYLHFYIGCQVQSVLDGRACDGKLLHIVGDGCWIDMGIAAPVKQPEIEAIMPILRPLSDMRYVELNECGNLVYDFSDDPILGNHKWQDFEIGLAPEQFKYLLDRHFDIFGLIKAGLAIDKTKLNTNEST